MPPFLDYMKTVRFYTLGCKVNQYETQVIREQFQAAGFQELEESLPVGVCVINTCTVTHQADRDSLYLIRRACRENPDAKIVVTGCLTEFDGAKILNEGSDCLILKNKDKLNILYFLNGHNRPDRDNGPSISYFKNHSRAFLKVQDGCNYYCSYCKVRLARGKSRSRALSEVKKDVDALARNGYLEIVLSGICLGSYGRELTPGLNLARLIEELQSIPGNFRIRLSSIEANDVTDELLDIMTKSNRVCRHLHIPVQSGDEQILKQMNRAYSPGQYIKLIQRIRRCMPEVAITTDVMVGFPGETEVNFNNSVELIKKIQPSRVHIFPYSRRPNTPAYNLGESVSEEEIKLRTAILQKITRGLRLAYCQKLISRTAEVLIERKVSGCPDLWEGYTDNYIKVRVESNLNLKNQIIRVELRQIHGDFVLADIA